MVGYPYASSAWYPQPSGNVAVEQYTDYRNFARAVVRADRAQVVLVQKD